MNTLVISVEARTDTDTATTPAPGSSGSCGGTGSFATVLPKD